jgi:hypothetical protein
VGNRTAVKVVKNKMAPPFAKVEFDLLYGEGISAEGDVLDLGVKKEMIEKSGAWYSYQGERMGQGRDQAKQFLKDHPDLMKDLRGRILDAYGIGVKGAAQKSAAVSDLVTKSEAVSASKAETPAQRAATVQAKPAVPEKAMAKPTDAKKAPLKK